MNKEKTFLSWNVNGLRAVEKKGALDFLHRGEYDLIALQETKISHDTALPEKLKSPNGYHAYWDYSSEKKGYSGVVVYTKEIPEKVVTEFPGHPLLTKEGRLLQLDFADFTFFNIYFPNGKSGPDRLKYKLEFYAQFLSYLKKLKAAGKKIIFCGDVNTAHTALDLARPKENEKVSGFLLEERSWLDEIVATGFLDTFRLFNKEGGNYSWWDQKTHARERNVGWRIDYFFVSDNLRAKVTDAFILDQTLGSDHAPVGIKIRL